MFLRTSETHICKIMNICMVVLYRQIVYCARLKKKPVAFSNSFLNHVVLWFDLLSTFHLFCVMVYAGEDCKWKQKIYTGSKCFYSNWNGKVDNCASLVESFCGTWKCHFSNEYLLLKVDFPTSRIQSFVFCWRLWIYIDCLANTNWTKTSKGCQSFKCDNSMAHSLFV